MLSHLLGGFTAMRQKRKVFSSLKKAAILRRHLIDHVPVSELCDEIGLAPSVFYRWQKDLFDNATAALDAGSKRMSKHKAKQDKKIKSLQEKITTKNEVLAELMEEHVKLKKELGEL
ncbi:MAG: transposase [Gammaproteobacteria bacterium]|nr:transposase [Gammaproteobacteria bacterium]